MNVLYLSYDGMTDPLGQSQVLPYLRGLSEQGYTIHLVSYEKQDKFKKHRNHIQKICDDANICWHPQDYVLGGSILTTLKQVRRMRKIAFYLNEKYTFSIVHCRSYIAALAGLRLKQKKGAKFIFDMRGFWADERVDGGLWNLKNPLYKTIYRYFKRKELQFFRESDYTISLTHNGKNEIESWKPLKDKNLNIEVIPCCVDLDLFNPARIDLSEQQTVKEQLGIQDSNFVLGYVGSIGTWYMLPEMLDYFKLQLTHNEQAVFLFVTGESPDFIKSAAREKNIPPEKIIVVSALHKDVPLYLSLFDKSIFFIRSTFSKKASSPTKQGEIMAMGIPLVCNSGVGDTDEVVLKYNCGHVVKTFSDVAYLEAIESKEHFDPDTIASGAKNYFSLEEGVKRYVKVYNSVHG